MSYPAAEEPPERVGAGPNTPRTEPPGTPAREPAATTAPEREGQVPRTKTALAHNALIAGAVLLILLLVFILENTKSVNITYFGVGFHLPLGVALLLAAIAGALIVGIVGTARIMQLRRRVRRRT